MTLARWERPALIENAAGYLVLGGAVYCEVRTEAAGNALADLFEDRDGLTPLANPFLASDGVPGFHVAGGSYQVRLYKTGYDETFRYQAIGTGAEVDSDAFVPFTAASATGAASIALAEDTDNGSNTVTLKAPASVTADRTVTLPDADGTALVGGLGSTDNRLLRADGTGGQTAQGSAVTVDDSGNVDGVGTLTTTGAVTITSNNGLVVNASTAAPVLQARRSDTPSVGRTIGYIDIEERDTAGTLTDATVRLAGESTSVTPGAVSGQLIVQTLQAGSAGQRMAVGAGVYHPSATGGDKGNNTINFGAVYDDNVLLSCYVFDAALDGAIDLVKWDGMVPGERLHEDARRFASRLGTDTDPLDLDSYIAHWRAKRHLTALPNEARFDPVQGLPAGAWIQRLIETVETQAVHIAQLHERLKALEER